MNKYLEWLIDHKRQIIIVGGVFIFILLLFVIGLWKFYFNTDLKIKEADKKDFLIESNDKDEDIISVDSDLKLKEEPPEENLVSIDIKGAVNNPGIYNISNTSRISDALNLAGGIRDDADLSVINLSKKVFDEMVIIIYTKDEVNNFVEVKKQEEEKQEKCVLAEEKLVNDACIYSNSDISDDDEKISMVSLNLATKEELMSLPGIGESKALLIIEYRDTNNGFKTIDEIKNIKGIGDSIFEKIKDYITV